MSLQFQSTNSPRRAATDTESQSPRSEADRRRHKRIAIHCLGRFMRGDKAEYPCKLINISIGGAAMTTAQAVHTGEHVIAYFEEIGRIDGAVIRHIEGGFAMQIQGTQHRREKLAAQLTWLANRRVLGIPEARRHERLMPTKLENIMVLPDGQRIECHILDISISGASVACPLLPPIGMDVSFGRLRAKIVRHHEQGVGLQFLDIQNPFRSETAFQLSRSRL